jgi:hypothetical protein
VAQNGILNGYIQLEADRAAHVLPWERELQQEESTAMHDLSRAPATAVCSGKSVSRPADAAAADLRESRPDVSTQVARPAHPSVVGWRGQLVDLPAEDPRGPGRGRRRQRRERCTEDAAGERRRAQRRPRDGGGGADQRCHFPLARCHPGTQKPLLEAARGSRIAKP